MSLPCCRPSRDNPGPSSAHSLLLVAIHRICSPGPKTDVADWYGRTILSALWGFDRERFSSQAFWDGFEQLLPEKQAGEQSEEHDPLEEAQVRLLGQPLYHGTDSKIHVHAFYCLLGLSLRHYVHRQAQSFWPSITLEEMQKELEQIQQFVLLYPAQGAGPYRTATVISTQSLIQKGLAETP